MKYVCDKCKKPHEDQPGYLAYGFKKGNPFLVRLCKECSDNMSQLEIDSLAERQKPISTSEELGILGH